MLAIREGRPFGGVVCVQTSSSIDHPATFHLRGTLSKHPTAAGPRLRAICQHKYLLLLVEKERVRLLRANKSPIDPADR